MTSPAPLDMSKRYRLRQSPTLVSADFRKNGDGIQQRFGGAAALERKTRQKAETDLPEDRVFAWKFADDVRTPRPKRPADGSRIVFDDVECCDFGHSGSDVASVSRRDDECFQYIGDARQSGAALLGSEVIVSSSRFLARRFARATNDWNIERTPSVNMASISRSKAIMTAWRRSDPTCWKA